MIMIMVCSQHTPKHDHTALYEKAHQRIDTAKSEFYFAFIIYKLISISFSALIFLVLRGGTQDFVIIIESKLTNQL